MQNAFQTSFLPAMQKNETVYFTYKKPYKFNFETTNGNILLEMRTSTCSAPYVRLQVANARYPIFTCYS